MSTALALLAVVLAGTIVLSVCAIALRNRLTALAWCLELARAEFDVQVRRRHCLLPSLIESVRPVAGQHASLIDLVARTHTQALAASGSQERMRAEGLLSEGVAELLAVAGAHPILWSAPHFADLRDDILDVDRKIGDTRCRLDQAARAYGAALDHYPAILIGDRFDMTGRHSRNFGLGRALRGEVLEVRP